MRKWFRIFLNINLGDYFIFPWLSGTYENLLLVLRRTVHGFGCLIVSNGTSLGVDERITRDISEKLERKQFRSGQERGLINMRPPG